MRLYSDEIVTKSVTPDMVTLCGGNVIQALAPWISGETPISVLPSAVAAEPCWLPAQLAVQHSQYQKVYAYTDRSGRMGYGQLQIVNPIREGDEVKGSNNARILGGPGGMLRYSDLDILMALSHAFIKQGSRAQVSLPNLANLMGANELVVEDVKASLQRMTRTEIQLGSSGVPFRLLQESNVSHARKTYEIVAVPSEYWLSSLTRLDVTPASLAGYAWLRRHFGRAYLARILYTYIATLATASPDARGGSFRVHSEVLRSRYEPRIRKSDTDTGRIYDVYRYALSHPSCPTRQAFEVLEKSGFVEIQWPNDASPWFSGRINLRNEDIIRYSENKGWIETGTVGHSLAVQGKANLDYSKKVGDSLDIESLKWHGIINRLARVPAKFRDALLQLGWKHRQIALVQLVAIGTASSERRPDVRRAAGGIFGERIRKERVSDWTSLAAIKVARPKDFEYIREGIKATERYAKSAILAGDKWIDLNRLKRAAAWVKTDDVYAVVVRKVLREESGIPSFSSSV